MKDHFYLNTPRGRRFDAPAGHDEPPVLGAGGGPAPLPARWCTMSHCSPEKGCDTTRGALAAEVAALREALKKAEVAADQLRSDIELRHGHDGSTDAACEICDELAAMKARHEAALKQARAEERERMIPVATITTFENGRVEWVSYHAHRLGHVLQRGETLYAIRALPDLEEA